MKSVLLAFDKFKGAFSGRAACQAAEEAVRQIAPDARCQILPIADGGEGTAEAVCEALGGRWEEVRAEDALGHPIATRFAVVGGSGGAPLEAVVEMSSASGLWRCDGDGRDPWRASTFGTGQMMGAAAGLGVAKMVVGIGGSATNDGGMGMARALGFRFLDRLGAEVVELPGGFEKVERIVAPDGAGAFPEVTVACDVTNPLLGPSGATRIYGPQKGIGTEEEMLRHEDRLGRLADLVARDLGCDHRAVPGSGAAGGLGFGLLSFCGARLEPGFELVADLLDLERAVARADVVLTGEGCLDAQTADGKGPAGVARMARRHGKPVLGFAGVVDRSETAQEAIAGLFDGAFEVKPEGMSVQQAIAVGAVLLTEAVAQNTALRRLLR
ncbi:glycerate kinase [soil metagenome]